MRHYTSFYLVNPTTVVVREGEAQIHLIDLKHPGGQGAGVYNTEIWVRPKDATPILGVNLNNVMGQVAFGWAKVTCPDCENLRYYWILIKRGENAWVSEIDTDEVPSIKENLGTVIAAGADNLAALEKVMPAGKRIQASSPTQP